VQQAAQGVVLQVELLEALPDLRREVSPAVSLAERLQLGVQRVE
jgi:hypothetical protein